MNGDNGIMCSHGDPSSEKRVIIGYRLDSTTSINGVYNKNEMTSNEFAQLVNRFVKGKYILITTIQSLASDYIPAHTAIMAIKAIPAIVKRV